MMFAVAWMKSHGASALDWLADATHSLYAGLAGSVAVLLTASAVAMLLRADKPERAVLRPRRLASSL